MELNFKDFYIGYKSHPKFTINKIIEDDIIQVIVQKYETLVFSNKGDLLGDPNFGCDLQKILFQTRLSANNVKKIVIEQIEDYIPEILNIEYSLDIKFVNDSENYQDIMIIEFEISGYTVSAVIS